MHPRLHARHAQQLVSLTAVDAGHGCDGDGAGRPIGGRPDQVPVAPNRHHAAKGVVGGEHQRAQRIRVRGAVDVQGEARVASARPRWRNVEEQTLLLRINTKMKHEK
jgi:hypothetical protein